ncbi:glycosyltransferase family 2 protein [Fluviicola sp.]|uniref:glycosyltransferase family 2 protein n=1 Tax=Fluviicola sp. TaxID=1917219 RepID=UPI003D2AA4F3
MNSLAVVIITLNEERNIERCLKSIRDLADEIIVLDAFSSDKTAEICAKYGVRFEQRAWEGYSASKNYLNSLVSSDYILSLDADESLSEELYNEIKAEKITGFSGTYSVNRLTNYMGKWIRHSGWYPDIKPRLFPKEGSYWSGEYVHEELVHPPSNLQVFKGVLEHYSYYSYEDHRPELINTRFLQRRNFMQKEKRSDH